MATEFYKSIPEEIKGKLEEYCEKYSYNPDRQLSIRNELIDCFGFIATPEGYDFWQKHNDNNTFPQWSDELNRFIDPPQVNTITVNADEYQAMREIMIMYLKDLLAKPFLHDSILAAAKRMGIDINEINK